MLRSNVWKSGLLQIAHMDDSGSSFPNVFQCGEVIDRPDGSAYMVLQVLGQGTFGQVYKCVRNNVLCAVKVVRSERAYLSHGMHEIRMLRRLNENRLTAFFSEFYEDFMYKDKLCISMELLGFNLFEVLKIGMFRGFGHSVLRKVALQIAEGLDVLFRMNIVHCDLKPENILVSDPESIKIKIIDFGNALDNTKGAGFYVQSRYYRAPEVILGLLYDHAVDVWSFGCIVYELFTGSPLFPGKNNDEMVARMAGLFGAVPRYMIEHGENSHMYFDKVIADDIPMSHFASSKPKTQKKALANIARTFDLQPKQSDGVFAKRHTIAKEPYLYQNHNFDSNRSCSKDEIQTHSIEQSSICQDMPFSEFHNFRSPSKDAYFNDHLLHEDNFDSHNFSSLYTHSRDQARVQSSRIPAGGISQKRRVHNLENCSTITDNQINAKGTSNRHSPRSSLRANNIYIKKIASKNFSRHIPTYKSSHVGSDMICNGIDSRYQSQEHYKIYQAPHEPKNCKKHSIMTKTPFRGHRAMIDKCLENHGTPLQNFETDYEGTKSLHHQNADLYNLSSCNSAGFPHSNRNLSIPHYTAVTPEKLQSYVCKNLESYNHSFHDCADKRNSRKKNYCLEQDSSDFYTLETCEFINKTSDPSFKHSNNTMIEEKKISGGTNRISAESTSKDVTGFDFSNTESKSFFNCVDANTKRRSNILPTNLDIGSYGGEITLKSIKTDLVTSQSLSKTNTSCNFGTVIKNKQHPHKQFTKLDYEISDRSNHHRSKFSGKSEREDFARNFVCDANNRNTIFSVTQNHFIKSNCTKNSSEQIGHVKTKTVCSENPKHEGLHKYIAQTLDNNEFESSYEQRGSERYDHAYLSDLGVDFPTHSYKDYNNTEFKHSSLNKERVRKHTNTSRDSKINMDIISRLPSGRISKTFRHAPVCSSNKQEISYAAKGHHNSVKNFKHTNHEYDYLRMQKNHVGKNSSIYLQLKHKNTINNAEFRSSQRKSLERHSSLTSEDSRELNRGESDLDLKFSQNNMNDKLRSETYNQTLINTKTNSDSQTYTNYHADDIRLKQDQHYFFSDQLDDRVPSFFQQLSSDCKIKENEPISQHLSTDSDYSIEHARSDLHSFPGESRISSYYMYENLEVDYILKPHLLNIEYLDFTQFKQKIINDCTEENRNNELLRFLLFVLNLNHLERPCISEILHHPYLHTTNETIPIMHYPHNERKFSTRNITNPRPNEEINRRFSTAMQKAHNKSVGRNLERKKSAYRFKDFDF